MVTEGLLLPNMDHLGSVLQDELCGVQKELKESTVAMANKAVLVAQMVMAPPAPAAAVADSRYVAPSSKMHTPQRRCRCFLCD